MTRDRRAELQGWVERARAFTGWSFAELGATEVGPRPWDYAEVVREHSPRADGEGVALDLGTGGGEQLAALLPVLPRRVVALEQWPPNAPVARARLAPLGVEVVHAATEPCALPLRGASVDVVLARHESFEADEVYRVLRPGGVLITQQACGSAGSWPELAEFLPMTDWSHVIPEMRSALHAAGLQVLRDQEHAGRTRYPSLGALVFLLQVTHVWECPTFSLDRHLGALLALEARYGDYEGAVTVTEPRTLFVARRPATEAAAGHRGSTAPPDG